MIAEIIINSNVKDLNKTFDYNIPKELIEKVEIGSRVLVPFGFKKSLEEGFVVNIKEKSEYKIKDICKVEENKYLENTNVQLAKWMANRYFCNVSDCIKLMLPPGKTTKVLDNRIKEKKMNFINLEKDKREIEEDIKIGKIKSEKQIRIMKFLMKNGETLISDAEVLSEVSKAVMKTLEKNGYLKIYEKQVERNPFANKIVEKSKKLVLADEQNKAYNAVADSIDDCMHSEFLLFGVTGSRKNRGIFAIDRKSFKRKKI